MAEKLKRYYAEAVNPVRARLGAQDMCLSDDVGVLEDRCAELEAQAEALEVIKRGLEARCRRRSQEDVPQPKIACRLHGMSEAVVLPNGHRECWLCVRGAMER